MLKIWGRRTSFNVQKVLWLVGEIELAHEHIRAGGGLGRLNEPTFRALNRWSRSRVTGGRCGGLGIAHHSAAPGGMYGRGSFWLDDPAERSRVEGWRDWSQTSLQPDFLMGVFWGYYRTPKAQGDWPAISRSLDRCAEHSRLLDSVLATRPFLTGDQLSLPEIPIGTSLYRYFELDKIAVR